MLAFGFLALVLGSPRSKRVNKVLNLVLIFAIGFVPLLQSQTYAAYAAEVDAQLSEREQVQQQDDLQTKINEGILGPAFDPHANPLAAEGDSTTLSAPDALQVTSPDQAFLDVNALPDLAPSPVLAPVLQSATCTDPKDSDVDGLTDCQEGLLGSDPLSVDSDSDGLSDFQEVTGFNFGGTQWYSNPTKASTLNDEIPDGQKCPAWPACLDTNDNGIPDLLDRDMDGDGVPNTSDLTPLGMSATTFSEYQPLLLTVNGLEPNTPTYVEFQIRPDNANHLWYAFNVLDWPDGDIQGQIQRDNTFTSTGRIKTFFDVCVQASIAGGGDPLQPCRMSPEDNGDIKLVPMLEIQTYASKLPTTADLNTFGGISVKNFDAAGAQKIAYLPLQLVIDPNTEDRSGLLRQDALSTNDNDGRP